MPTTKLFAGVLLFFATASVADEAPVLTSVARCADARAGVFKAANGPLVAITPAEQAGADYELFAVTPLDGGWVLPAFKRERRLLNCGGVAASSAPFADDEGSVHRVRVHGYFFAGDREPASPEELETWLRDRRAIPLTYTLLCWMDGALAAAGPWACSKIRIEETIIPVRPVGQ